MSAPTPDVWLPRRLGAIWAEAESTDAAETRGVIGKDGGMPWRLPEDLKWFQRLTLGGTVIMGRKTWESLPEAFRPLKERRNLVVTRDLDFSAVGAEPLNSPAAALRAVAGARQPVWVIGGAQLYADVLGEVDVVARTQIHTKIAHGDTFAPVLTANDWRLTWQSDTRRSTSGLDYHHEIHRRVSPTPVE